MKIGFVGCGNMAEAIARGLPEHELFGYDVNDERRRFFERELGVEIAPNNPGVVDNSEVVVIAVKPQNRKELFKELAKLSLERKILVSIMAGVSIDEIAQETGCRVPRVVRCMPNTPMLVKASVIGAHAPLVLQDTVRALFEPVGMVIFFDKEIDLDRVTALSGTGPAYIFYFLETLVEAGVRIGLDREIATRMMFGTADGAIRLLFHEGCDPVELRRKVTSPGGTTEAAMRVFAEEDFGATVAKAVEAAFRRSVELGKNG